MTHQSFTYEWEEIEELNLDGEPTGNYFLKVEAADGSHNVMMTSQSRLDRIASIESIWVKYGPPT